MPVYAGLCIKWPLFSSERLTESLPYWKLEFGTILKVSDFSQLLTFDAALRFSIDEQIMHVLLEK